MKSRFSLRSRSHDMDIERFRTRLIAKLCVVFIAITQIILRLITIFFETGFNIHIHLLTLISLPFFALMAVVVCFEYFLFKKIGPKVMAYSQLIDIILLLLFTAEWVISTATIFLRLGKTATGNLCLPLSSIFVFTGYQWRILCLFFLAQSWKLLIIPPTLTLGLILGFVAHYSPVSDAWTLVRGIPHIIYIILLFYFLDKIKWKEILTNAQQERWIRINDFILNNIPENILILELGGAVTFVSEYCKAFMQNVHLPQNPRDLLTNIKDLEQQPETDLSPTKQMERLATSHGLLESAVSTENHHFKHEKVEDLETLIRIFQVVIKDANLQERQFLIYNGKLQVEDHSQKSIEIKISYIQQHNKGYIILIIRDTTQRDLLVTLEDNNKYKDQLLASVSHELRAPLNGNINLVESAIQDISVPINVKEKLLTPALRSSQYLLHLINDILDMSQIKAQKLRLIFKAGNLKQTLKDTLQLIELQAKKKGVEISLIIHPDIQDTLCTDHVRLSQIILNLLNNAIKFTQEGSVILSALPTEDLNRIKLSVQDSGIGMAQEDIKKLFSDYTHIEFKERAEINPTGVGLGLNIAYNLAKLLGPQGIVVESVLGKGSTFSFIVENREDQLEPKDLVALNKTFHEVPEEFQETEPKISLRILSTSALLLGDSEESHHCSCAKVLVVDDNPFNIMAFETVLKTLNCKCDAVYDGKTAIERICKRKNPCCSQPYQVIFMDQEMPGMTGSEAVCELRRLQSENLIPSIRIIGCTAQCSAKDVEKFMESGLDKCIQKPITVPCLQEILQEYEVS